MRISDLSSDVCSSDLHDEAADQRRIDLEVELNLAADAGTQGFEQRGLLGIGERAGRGHLGGDLAAPARQLGEIGLDHRRQGEEAMVRSEEHTSELQSLMRISYAVFCLKKKKPQTNRTK